MRTLAYGTVLVMLALTGFAGESLPLVAAGRSRFVIYRDPAGPPSVTLAAQELQRVIEVATGVRLPLSDAPAVPMISLGGNPAAEAVGVRAEGLPHDAFRMVTREGNLYLLGRDFPGDQFPERGWTSRGTYNDVGRAVAARHPDKALAGYVYYNYMYPPAEPIPMQPNVWLVLAPLNYYGYGLLKPVYRDEFPQLIEGWLKVTPNFVYHNYSNWLRSFNGAPLPAARELLKFEVPVSARLGVKGYEMLGLGAWGVGAPTNYIYVKQLWDPGTDVDQTYAEWLQLAYGPASGPMREMLDLIETRFAATKSAESPVYNGQMYEMNYAKVELIYLPIFPQMEALYVDALRRTRSAKQKRRLELFGENLVQLHWGMTRAGMTWPEAETSIFHRSDADYEQFLKDREFAWWLYRDHGRRYTKPIWRGEWSD